MKTALAVIFALSATAVFAAPAGWDRPGGFKSQVNGGSLSGPVSQGCNDPGFIDRDGDGPKEAEPACPHLHPTPQ